MTRDTIAQSHHAFLEAETSRQSRIPAAARRAGREIGEMIADALELSKNQAYEVSFHVNLDAGQLFDGERIGIRARNCTGPADPCDLPRRFARILAFQIQLDSSMRVAELRVEMNDRLTARADGETSRLDDSGVDGPDDEMHQAFTVSDDGLRHHAEAIAKRSCVRQRFETDAAFLGHLSFVPRQRRDGAGDRPQAPIFTESMG